MHKIFIFLVAVSVIIFMLWPPALVNSAKQPTDQIGKIEKIRKAFRPIPNQYIVVLKEEAVLSKAAEGLEHEASAIVSSVAEDLTRSYGGTRNHTYQFAFKGFSVAMCESAAIALSRDPRVEVVAEDSEVSLAQQSTPWGLDRIDSIPRNGMYEYNSSGAGVNVFVIDTGINRTHVEFGDRAALARDVFNGNGQDCSGHGTLVAGVIGGKTFGVAKGVNLYSVRVFNYCPGGPQNSTANVINGIEWVRANHNTAQFPGPDIANMSFELACGGPPQPGTDCALLNAAVQNLINDGVTTVVAAGNGGRDQQCNPFSVDVSTVSPASVIDAITASAIDTSDRRVTNVRPNNACCPSGQPTCFTPPCNLPNSYPVWIYANTGAGVDLFAPGRDIPSAFIGSNTATCTQSGTSFAAPHVSGVAALYLQAVPTATRVQVRNEIVNKSRLNMVVDPGPGSPNRLLNSGFITPINPAYQGTHDAADCTYILGWAWDANRPNTPIDVDIFDGPNLLAKALPARYFRQDLLNAGIGNGYHAFVLNTPTSLRDGQNHQVTVRVAGTNINLAATPKNVYCPSQAIYEGYHDGADCNTIWGWAWDRNLPNTPISVKIYNGAALLATVSANLFRQDLLNAGIGNGYHAFVYTVPASLKDGLSHQIYVKFPNNANLGWTPRAITCSQSIQVVSGTYGGNCGAPTGNATWHLAPSCNNLMSCNYSVSYQTLGDPVPGCAKDYVARWRCGSNPTIRSASASPEAGYGSIVPLTCN